MEKLYTKAIIIGRFQPFHNGHLTLFQKAAEIADEIVCLIGSANQARTPENPWSHGERLGMVKWSLADAKLSIPISFCPLHDYKYNDADWVQEVQEAVHLSCDNGPEGHNIVLVGHHKDGDASTYYLDMFPQWDYVETDPSDEIVGFGLHATQIRDTYFEFNMDHLACPIRGGASQHVQFIQQSVSERVFNYLGSWSKQDKYKDVDAEWHYYDKYPEDWGRGPFVTTDAFVYCLGHILLIRRGRIPGKGLYAIPGGFLELDESIHAGVIRELKEETKIKVPVPVLHGSMKHLEVFDAPKRSLRGRVITHCGLINLRNETTLPEVRGADDADKAIWVPLAEFNDNYRSQMFEDHFDIVMRMKSLIK